MSFFRYNKIWVLFSFISLISCVEEFEPETIFFEDLLVVEATITNEFKKQEVKLSRTNEFSQDLIFETQATVQVIDDTQSIYQFSEAESGTYISESEFSVTPERTYTLKIVTKDNKSYVSSSVKPPSETAELTEVSFINSTNSQGVEGIIILVDSFDPFGESRYYRYEFEETQRIVAPFYNPNELIIVSDSPPFEVGLELGAEQKGVCYKTTKSKSSIIQTQTNNLGEDRVTKFPVKFLSKTDSIIRDRYSVLVKQHVQTFEAYSYYQNLDDFSSSENVFSDKQPGFIEGNIISENNPLERVIGFFEINSVSEKRLFINFREAFPNENNLPYFSPCTELIPFLTDPEDSNNSPLIDLIKQDAIRFWQTREDFFGNPIENPPYVVINKECGDCTVFGSNVKPDFWID
jgi:hypothetical protein